MEFYKLDKDDLLRLLEINSVNIPLHKRLENDFIHNSPLKQISIDITASIVPKLSKQRKNKSKNKKTIQINKCTNQSVKKNRNQSLKKCLMKSLGKSTQKSLKRSVQTCMQKSIKKNLNQSINQNMGDYIEPTKQYKL
jgi:hypothetical protein